MKYISKLCRLLPPPILVLIIQPTAKVPIKAVVPTISWNLFGCQFREIIKPISKITKVPVAMSIPKIMPGE
jgi:hypothetical protein